MGIPLIGVFELLLISWHLQAAPILLPQDVPLSQSKFMVTQLKNPLVEGTAITIFSPDETKLLLLRERISKLLIFLPIQSFIILNQIYLIANTLSNQFLYQYPLTVGT